MQTGYLEASNTIHSLQSLNMQAYRCARCPSDVKIPCRKRHVLQVCSVISEDATVEEISLAWKRRGSMILDLGVNWSLHRPVDLSDQFPPSSACNPCVHCEQQDQQRLTGRSPYRSMLKSRPRRRKQSYQNRPTLRDMSGKEAHLCRTSSCAWHEAHAYCGP